MTAAVSVSEIADWAQIVGVALALLALAIAWFQLRKAVDETSNAAADAKRAVAVAEGQAVLALDLALSQPTFEALRAKINTKSVTAADDVVLRRYIATFERLGLLIEKGIITISVADHFYGNRLEKLLVNAGSRVSAIVRHSSSSGAVGEGPGREGWRIFLELWKKMGDVDAGGRDLPPAPEIARS